MLLVIFVLLGGTIWFFWPKAEIKITRVATATPASAEVPKPIMETLPTICGNFFKVACENKKVFHDPTGVVDPDLKGEISALRLYEKILHAHKGWTSEKVEIELVRRIYTRQRVQQLHVTFNWVKTEVRRFIQRQAPGVFSAEERKGMLRELDRTILQLPPPVSVYADELDLLTKNDVYYEQTANGVKRMRIGGAYLLAVKSWFNRVFTFAHELAHSIDPCEIKAAGLNIRAYDRLETCLLQKKVIYRSPDWSRCSANDQYPEAFADWVASSITAEAFVLKIDAFHSFQDREAAAINAVKDICDEGSSWVKIDMTQYPSPKIRVEEIFGANQEVRRFLDCKIPKRGGDQCHF